MSFSDITPKFGKVKYQLKKDGDFYSNAHQEGDLIKITRITPELALTRSRKERIWFSGRDLVIPGLVNSAVLLLKNPTSQPFSYPGFEDYLQYDPDKPETHKKQVYAGDR